MIGGGAGGAAGDVAGAIFGAHPDTTTARTKLRRNARGVFSGIIAEITDASRARSSLFLYGNTMATSFLSGVSARPTMICSERAVASGPRPDGRDEYASGRGKVAGCRRDDGALADRDRPSESNRLADIFLAHEIDDRLRSGVRW